MFKDFSKAVHAQYNEMVKHELFIVDVLDIFESYLSFFPEGTNPIYKERREFDCNCCKNFIRRLGNLVAIIDGNIVTVWDNWESLPYPFDIVSKRMSELVRQAPIKTVFRSKEHQYGAEKTVDLKNNKAWEHFYGKVNVGHFTSEPDTKRGEREAIYQVLKRGLEELRTEDFQSVIELIDANALYKGSEYREAVVEFNKLQGKYDLAHDKNLFIWSNLDHRHARFRNTVIGTLVQDLGENVDLETAVKKFESKVAPENYKRSSALITPRMIDAAVGELRELGLEGALHRRYAQLSDVSVNAVLFVDNQVQNQMKDALKSLLMTETKPAPRELTATNIGIDDFIKDVVPEAVSMQALVKNNHQGNFMTVTGGDGPERLFQWDNNFAWSYDGEVTDSIKQRVKAAGGRTVGTKLRVSLSWFNRDDLDIHANTPYGHISFQNKRGILDVDMNAFGPSSDTPVENMSWMQNPTKGYYTFTVNNYTKRASDNGGFIIEVESENKITQYHHERHLRQSESSSEIKLYIEDSVIKSVEVGAGFTNKATSQDKWGIKTESLVPVNILMTSPNHWDQKIGAKHWFFILKDCVNPEGTRGIYNEFLRGDLTKHRKVFEVLGSKMKTEPSANQLAGIGFTKGRDDEVTIVVKTAKATRSFNVKF